MTGLKFIQQLPDEIKNKIIAHWGSIENFYKNVFDLHAQHYKLAIYKPNNYKQQLAKIESELYDIEDLLEGLGADGRGLTSEISSDHGDIIVRKEIHKLDIYLRQNGSDYHTMRKWMKDTYGI